MTGRRLKPHECSVWKERSGYFIVDCPICGRVGGRNLEDDAKAIAARHLEVGGFERASTS